VLNTTQVDIFATQTVYYGGKVGWLVLLTTNQDPFDLRYARV
jgi:hypothetical protein